jgi:hypothetical protein
MTCTALVLLALMAARAEGQFSKPPPVGLDPTTIEQMERLPKYTKDIEIPSWVKALAAAAFFYLVRAIMRPGEKNPELLPVLERDKGASDSELSELTAQVRVTGALGLPPRMSDSELSELTEKVLQRARALQQDSADDTGKERNFTVSQTIPIGKWLRIKLRDCPSFVGYTYFDQQAGLSAKGSSQADSKLAVAPVITVRLPIPGQSWRVLAQEELDMLGLPERPEWLANYGA